MRRRLPLLLLLAALAAAMLTSFLGFFFFRDNFSTHYPIKYLSAAAFRTGQIPYWNPADGGGQPLAGNPNTLTFYPDNALYLFLPSHVAFNLHFILHLIVAWFAMHALVRELLGRHSVPEPIRLPEDAHRGQMPAAAANPARFAAWMYVLSGVAITGCAFYNLIVAVALVPLAFLAVERRSAALLGLSFGLLALAGEPVTLLGGALACAILARDRPAWISLVTAIPIAIAISLPQVIAYSEIAGEVERVRGYSATTILNASLDPLRLVEVLTGPFLRSAQPHLFLSLFAGLIVVPALMRRSRYTWVAAVMFFFALGRFNPFAAAILPHLRVARFPEKLALPMMVSLCVLSGLFFAGAPRKKLWLLGTFVPLAFWAVATIPIDWFGPYAGRSSGTMLAERSWQGGKGRVYRAARTGGQRLDRQEYRLRARDGEPLFGITSGMQFVLNRSGDGMHSLLSRIVSERFALTRNEAYLRIATSRHAFIVPRSQGVRSMQEAVQRIERGQRGIAPMGLNGFMSPADARIERYSESLGQISMSVSTPAPALVLVNQSFFSAWVARSGERELRTMPIDIDRLGVLVPAGRHEVVLEFGRHRTAVLGSWFASTIIMMTLLVALRRGRGGDSRRLWRLWQSSFFLSAPRKRTYETAP